MIKLRIIGEINLVKNFSQAKEPSKSLIIGLAQVKILRFCLVFKFTLRFEFAIKPKVLRIKLLCFSDNFIKRRHI